MMKVCGIHVKLVGHFKGHIHLKSPTNIVITTATLRTNTVAATSRFGLLLKEAIHQQNDLSSSILPTYLVWLTQTLPWIMASV